jgi:hypothetical protein
MHTAMEKEQGEGNTGLTVCKVSLPGKTGNMQQKNCTERRKNRHEKNPQKTKKTLAFFNE